MTSNILQPTMQALSILKLLDHVGPGRITTVGDHFAAANVPTEVVLRLADRKTVYRPSCSPWHRVAPDNGLIRPAQTDRDGFSQVSLPAAESAPVLRYCEVKHDLCRADLTPNAS